MGVKITKTGFVKIAKDKSETYVQGVDHLWDICSIDPDVTLKDIITLVHTDPILRNLVGTYGQCDVRAFYEEVHKPCALKSNLHCIELARTITLNHEFRSLPERCNISLDVHGVGPDKSQDGKVIRNWAIDFTPASEMADVPIRLCKTLDFRDYRKEESYGNPPATFADDFTLIEVLGELFWEISFHGTPSERNEKLGEVLDAKKAVEDGTATLRSWDDLKKELDDNDETIQ